ncbi:hypothetical protein HDV63DRAFT_163103 [Trichoderma sp. SZMC 28014]
MATSNSASAAPKQEPLDALQSLINDVLVQTGKALRASRKDARGNLTHVPSTSQSKLPETIRLFHRALDELEVEIIEAKSVLLRDLNELQEKKKKLLAQTQASPQQPITIDIPSASPEPKDEPMADSIDVKPMAPFPNMSINLSEADHMDISAKEANGQQQQPQPPPPGGMNGMSGKASPAFASRLPAGDHKPTLDMLPETSTNQPAIKAEPSGMNFTNMEFTLAPPSNEASGQTNTSKEPFFDLTTFAPADGGDELLNLNNLLPDQTSAGNNNNNNKQPSISAAAHSISIPNANAAPKAEEQKFDANLNTEFFGNESGAADGMDFDFSLGGSGDDTFDDLMNNRDSNFELMDAGGDFDSAFFGLDKPDENAS